MLCARVVRGAASSAKLVRPALASRCKLYDARYGVRGRGEGQYAEAIGQVFEVTTKRLGFNREDEWKRVETFQRPARQVPKLSLF